MKTKILVKTLLPTVVGILLLTALSVSYAEECKIVIKFENNSDRPIVVRAIGFGKSAVTFSPNINVPLAIGATATFTAFPACTAGSPNNFQYKSYIGDYPTGLPTFYGVLWGNTYEVGRKISVQTLKEDEIYNPPKNKAGRNYNMSGAYKGSSLTDPTIDVLFGNP